MLIKTEDEIYKILSELNKKLDQKLLPDVFEKLDEHKDELKGRVTIEEVDRQELNFLFYKIYKELEFELITGEDELIAYVICLKKRGRT